MSAELLFALISAAYEVVSTNLLCENWVEVLGFERLTAATFVAFLYQPCDDAVNVDLRFVHVGRLHAVGGTGGRLTSGRWAGVGLDMGF